MSSGQLVRKIFKLWGWERDPPSDDDLEPTPAQNKAVVRAMHTLVSKLPQYGLIGGQGRTHLYLYDKTNILSVAAAQSRINPTQLVERERAFQKELRAGQKRHRRHNSFPHIAVESLLRDDVKEALDLFERERRNDTSSQAIAEYLNATKPNGIGRPMTANGVDQIMRGLNLNEALAKSWER